MNVTRTDLPGVVIIEPTIFRDNRGYFLETWSARRYQEIGIPPFVQDNAFFSFYGVLRGLHFQHPFAQGKLVSVVQGGVFDVVVDVRPNSPFFRQSVCVVLSAENGRQLYLPKGYAHGIVATSDSAYVTYKCTAPYQPQFEGSVRWDDPELAIPWPIATPILSAKDAAAPFLRDLPASRLPVFPTDQGAEVDRMSSH